MGPGEVTPQLPGPGVIAPAAFDPLRCHSVFQGLRTVHLKITSCLSTCSIISNLITGLIRTSIGFFAPLLCHLLFHLQIESVGPYPKFLLVAFSL